MQQSLLTGTAEDLIVTPEQAFLTDDHQQILRFALEAFTAGMGVALVTLVDIRGGAARALGAQMAVRGDGRYCGFVSGGCVEPAAAFEALEVIASGEDRQVRYGQGSPYFDIVLPCGGGITLCIHKLRTALPLLEVLNNLEQRRPAGLRYSPRHQTLHSLPASPTAGWHYDNFETGYRPCVRVIVCGRSIEAQTTANLARAAGYQTCPLETFTPANATLVDVDSAVVMLWHDLNRELPVLQTVREKNPFYIGALGSQRTHRQRMQQLAERGWSQEEINRIHAPIGLFPKARDARSLALSVLADVAAARLQPAAR